LKSSVSANYKITTLHI